MLAVYGVLLLALSALLFTWAYGQFRAPHPKAWTTGSLAANFVILVVIGLLAFGVGMIAKAALTFASGAIQGWHMALSAGIVVVGIALGRWLARRATPDAAMAETLDGATSATAAPANDSAPDGPPRPAQGAGKRFGRRRAA
jgi:hypothetical protein